MENRIIHNEIRWWHNVPATAHHFNRINAKQTVSITSGFLFTFLSHSYSHLCHLTKDGDCSHAWQSFMCFRYSFLLFYAHSFHGGSVWFVCRPKPFVCFNIFFLSSSPSPIWLFLLIFPFVELSGRRRCRWCCLLMNTHSKYENVLFSGFCFSVFIWHELRAEIHT